MTFVRNISAEALEGKLSVASEILESAAVDKKFSNASAVAIFNLRAAIISSALIGNDHALAIQTFISLLQSSGADNES